MCFLSHELVGFCFLRVGLLLTDFCSVFSLCAAHIYANSDLRLSSFGTEAVRVAVILVWFWLRISLNRVSFFCEWQ